MLPLCLGQATRLSRFLLEADKLYRATALLGVETDTEDCKGQILRQTELGALTPAQVEQAAQTLVGPQMQRPPQFSAIHVDGKRAYKLARAGKEVKLEPRAVTIHHLKVLSVKLPQVQIEVHASKGTYIRSLCRDLGTELGVGAHCEALRRLAAAGFKLEDAHALGDLMALEDPEALSARLISPLDMLAHLPLHQIDEQGALYLRQGRRVAAPEGSQEGQVWRVAHQGALVCAGLIEADGLLKPERVMAPPA
jgi:tRNA pseudouridine55 synthase